MNVYAVIILATLILGFIIDIVAEYLNLKNLKEELPQEFAGVYDDDTYKKSQQYTLTKTKFGFITSILNIIVLLVFWFSGGFNWLDLIVRNWVDGTIYLGLSYTGILLFANGLISLPFEIYNTFVIEEKFGFNKTTVKTFILDILKSTLLAIIIGAPLYAGILYIFEISGDNAWLIGWLAVTIFTITIQYVAPRWIMPLFNKYTPLEDGELKESILNYSKSVKFSLQNVYVMDGSKRSTKSNAFFTGFGKNRRIVLFDTLISKHSVPELVAILAHEIGHYKKRHILQGMLIGIVHTGILFFLLSIFLSHKDLFDAFYMENISIYTGLIFFGMLYSPIELILSLFLNVLSRKNEYQADRFAAETTKDSVHLINALKNLSKDNLSNLTPHPFYVFLNYSHPTVLDRIFKLKKITA